MRMRGPVLLALLAAATGAVGAIVSFEDCVAASVQSSGTYFSTKLVDATYDVDHGILDVVVRGDMFGSLPDYSNETNRLTTLHSAAAIMEYPLADSYTRFCTAVDNESCPFGPQNHTGFTTSFSLTHHYYFVSISVDLAVIDPTSDADVVGCVRTTITPTIISSVYAVLTYVPLGVLFLIAFSIIVAAIYNPWTGTKDFFSWSSNYGQDHDALRLVTPGFGDFVQYLQFAFFIAALNLNYPGFYPPVLSAIAWASLQFNIVFAEHHTRNVGFDNIYSPQTRYGISRQSELLGQNAPQDPWSCFTVWLLGVTGIVLLLVQSCFFVRWLYYRATSRQSVDLRSKNLPLTGGMCVRIFFNFLALPLVAFCSFQFVVAKGSPVYCSVFAAVLLFAWLFFALLIVFCIKRTRPQQALYDDLPTLLFLGPLYNTYTERGFMFCSVQLVCTFLRGIAFGAIQYSGIAQIVMLAIIEIVYLISLNLFRPYHRATSMNIYHIVLSVVRLLTALLSVAFVHNLQVSDTIKGWLAYTILIIHALVLAFVFFLHALQTIVETFARLAGLTAESSNTFARAFGLRQIARRRFALEKVELGTLDTSPHMHTLFTENGDPSAKTLASMTAMKNTDYSAGDADISEFSSVGPFVGGSQDRYASSAVPSPFVSGPPHSSSPVSPHSTFTYYRLPRRSRAVREIGPIQFDTSDATLQNPAAESAEAAAAETPVSSKADFADASNSAFVVPRNVDYAFRESDVYYHSRAARSQQPENLVPGLQEDLGSESALEPLPHEVLSREPLSVTSPYSRRLGTGPADPTGVSAGMKGWLTRQVNSASERLGIRKTRGFVVVRNTPMSPTAYAAARRSMFGQPPISPATENSESADVDYTQAEASSSTGLSNRTNVNNVNVIVDDTVPKNTITPIIRSPIPPSLRRQPQQPPVIALPNQVAVPSRVESPSPTRVDIPLMPQVDSRRTSQHGLFSDISLTADEGLMSPSLGTVPSGRVGDVIRTSGFYGRSDT
ncbi:uncharacterized protein V1518DRAFT_418311 [Limtongia smithiae]|uniref:uncharacterized protein n=1 Tax=Limtongia smithiae TaxID=1125753 RepID=UPI0034CEA907